MLLCSATRPEKTPFPPGSLGAQRQHGGAAEASQVLHLRPIIGLALRSERVGQPQIRPPPCSLASPSPGKPPNPGCSTIQARAASVRPCARNRSKSLHALVRRPCCLLFEAAQLGHHQFLSKTCGSTPSTFGQQPTLLHPVVRTERSVFPVSPEAGPTATESPVRSNRCSS